MGDTVEQACQGRGLGNKLIRARGHSVKRNWRAIYKKGCINSSASGTSLDTHDSL